MYDDRLLLVVAGLVALLGIAVAVSTLVRPASEPDPGTLAGSRRRAARLALSLALAWNALLGIAYIVLDVTAYGWYASPFIVTIAVATAFGVDWLVAQVEGVGSVAATMLTAALAIVCIAPLAAEAADVRHETPTRLELYPDTGRWLRQHLPPDATVGTLEVGLIGYYAHRNVVDFAGLLQPDAATEADHSKGLDGIAAEAFSRYRPDFVAMLRPGITSIVESARFRNDCELATTITHPDVVEVMDIYDCRR